MTTNRDHIKAALVAQFKISRELAGAIIDEVLVQIADQVMRGNRVELRGFGVFEPVVRRARVGRNPLKPEVAYIIPEHKSIRFKIGRTLHEVLNQDLAPSDLPAAAPASSASPDVPADQPPEGPSA